VPQRCPTDDEVTARSSARPVRVNVSERRYAGFGQRLDPPPSGASPQISESDAVRRGMAAQPAGFDPGPEPTVALASYSDDWGGLKSDGADKDPIRDRLAWALLFPHAVTSEPTGSGAPNPATTTTTPPPCRLATVFVPVDANSGQVLSTKKTEEPVIGG
jgi:hypothetical protein